MNSRAKNKITSALIVIAVIAANLVFASSAKAAISANAVISLTNSARIQSNLKPYRINTELTSSAYAKAQDILNYDYFAHYSPEGKSPWTFIKGAGYAYIYAGENLAINFDSADSTHNAWMASPTHKSNILDRDFTEIGVAVLTGEYQGKQTTVVVQHFGSPAKQIQPIGQKNKLKNQQKHQIENSKLNLNFNTVQTPEVSTESNDIIWYTSPILFAFKTIS